MTASLCPPPPGLPGRPEQDGGHPRKFEPAYARSTTDASTTYSASDMSDQEEKACDQ